MNKRTKYDNSRNQKGKFDNLYRLDEEDDEGFPPLHYNEQEGKPNNDQELSQEDNSNRMINDEASNNVQEGKKITFAASSSRYAKVHQQEKEQSKQIQRKSSLEHIQDKFKTQIEKKFKMKENQTQPKLLRASKVKIEVDISSKATREHKSFIQSSKNSYSAIPIIRSPQAVMSPTKRTLTQLSARNSQKNLCGGSEGVSTESIKPSMIDVMNLQADMSEMQKKEFDLKLSKQQQQEIIQDNSLTEDQRKIKLDNLKHYLIVDRVKNIIEKTKKMKEQQYKAGNRDQKFEMQLQIFKKLDTYLETKDYLQKINTINASTHKKLENAAAKISACRVFFKSKQNNHNKKIFQTSRQIENNEEVPNTTYADIYNILQKSYRYLNKKNDIIMSYDQTLGGSFLLELEKNVLGKDFKHNSDNYEISKYEKENFEDTSSHSNSDSNAFYNLLQYQLRSGYFHKGECEKIIDDQSLSVEPIQEDTQLSEAVQEQMTKDKNRKTETKQDMLDEYRKKAKKITNLLLHTSKNILKKNMQETNKAIQQARKVRINEKIQYQLNIRQIERSMKKSPNRFNKLNKLNDQQNIDSLSQSEQTIEQQIIQMKQEKFEDENQKNSLLNEMLPESSLSKIRNIDLQLLNLQKTLTPLNSSSLINKDVQTIKKSFERRFSAMNESKGILQTKQSKFSKGNIAVSSIRDDNQFGIPLIPFIQDDDAISNSSKYQRQILKMTQKVSDSGVLKDLNNSKTLQHQINQSQFEYELNNKQSNKNITSIQKIILKDKLDFNARIHQNTNDSTNTKPSFIYPPLLDQTQVHQKQHSLQLTLDKSPSSLFNHSQITSFEGNSLLMGLNRQKKQYGIRSRRQTENIPMQNEKIIAQKIIQSNKEKGFKVMNIKQIINDMKENDNNTTFARNMDDSYQLHRITNSSIKNYSISPLSIPSSYPNHKFTNIPNNQAAELFQLDQKERYHINKPRKTSPKVSQNNRNKEDAILQVKQELSNRLINKQSTPKNNNHIFLTDNIKSPLRDSPNEKNSISNFFPTMTRRSASNTNERMLNYSKTHDLQNLSDQKSFNRSISTSINQNVFVESQKQIDQIVNNINNFKLSYKIDKNHFCKQILEMQQKLEHQQENLTPQPLQSLRMCFNDAIPKSQKNYQYDRKALQKIL